MSWADDRLCMDRGSDSDDQELDRSLSELIQSIACKDDSGDEASGGRVVSGILDAVLARVEAEGRPIDAGRRAKRARAEDEEAGAGGKRARQRSTSCSTTSSTGSDVSRRRHRKHKHHRRKEDGPSPRVNPIFLWVKQDDTRIVEVLCEDYDKRNRLRLTKTAHGWRATPRTERLDSRSLDLSPPPPLVSVEESQTKDKKKPKRCARKNKRCDKKSDEGFNDRNDLDDHKYVDVVNNNNSSISNNNKVKPEVKVEPCVAEPKLRSFGYKKACYGKINTKKEGGKKLDDIDVYTFVDTPKTESENNMDFSDSEAELKTVDLDIKQEPQDDVVDDGLNVETNEDKPNVDFVTKCKPAEDEPVRNVSSEDNKIVCVDRPSGETVPLSEESCKNIEKDRIVEEKLGDENKDVNKDEDVIPELKTRNTEEKLEENDVHLEDNCNVSDAHKDVEVFIKVDDAPKVSTLEIENEIKEVSTLEIENEIKENSPRSSPKAELLTEGDSTQFKETPDPVTEPEKQIIDEVDQPKKEELHDSIKLEIPGLLNIPQIKHPNVLKHPESPNNDGPPFADSSSTEVLENGRIDHADSTMEEGEEDIEEEVEEEEEDEEEPLPEEIILPEPHLQTPEPSPPPVPEPSTAEPESRLVEISLQPDTSLDSDTLHLPDTTTKSDTALLINNNLTLGQKLSIKTTSDLTMDSSLLTDPLDSVVKSVQEPHVVTHTQRQMKTAEQLREEEIERQITADLDEDHLLAIEEILQGEECVEDFDEDDLPEEYPVTHESPVNLVIDLKAKDQVDNTGIPLSLRTDDFLEIFPTSLSLKEHSAMSPNLTPVVKKPETSTKPIPPAHQQSKTKFLESMLSYPKKCHTEHAKKADSSDQQEPLYLGVSRKSASPTVSSSDGRKFSSPELEPKPKRMKVDDITLKTILSRNKETPKTKVSKPRDNEETQQTADSTTKSRLLELLTNENDDHISKMDPLTQLKEVLSDPDLNVPDPLLVPRARLPALVANPAKEIPRLLASKSENLSYPKLLSDPDLLVVSLSHLQSLLQAAGKDEEMLKYHQHAQILQQHMKQEQVKQEHMKQEHMKQEHMKQEHSKQEQLKTEQPGMDAATATALNQMMWLPYLSQLEAAAMACGNTQDFMTMLNMVFPSGGYSQMNPYMMSSASPGINAYDYKSQLEFQQAFALWNEAMMQAATNQFAAQSLGSTNNISKLYQNYQDKYGAKGHSNSSKHQEPKQTSARTSPITLNYQQSKYRSSQYPYTSMFSIPTSTPTTSLPSTSYRTTPSTQSQSSYQSARQRSQQSYYGGYSSMRPPSVGTAATPKTESSISSSDLYKRHSLGGGASGSSNCKSIMNILSKPKQSEVKPPPQSRMYPTSTTMFPRETSVTLTSKPEPPKLKVKQPQHLVDPNSRPKLLNFEDHAEVGSTTGSLTPHVDDTHPNLWHPLFSSHQQKSYSSPWQWTTPVTVSGE